jgi:hypothetical protein
MQDWVEALVPFGILAGQDLPEARVFCNCELFNAPIIPACRQAGIINNQYVNAQIILNCITQHLSIKSHHQFQFSSALSI